MGEFAPPVETTTVETTTVEDLTVGVAAGYDDDQLEVDVDLEVDPLLDVDLDTTVD